MFETGACASLCMRSSRWYMPVQNPPHRSMSWRALITHWSPERCGWTTRPVDALLDAFVTGWCSGWTLRRVGTAEAGGFATRHVRSLDGVAALLSPATRL